MSYLQVIQQYSDSVTDSDWLTS